jgi:hypothetical protein
MHGASIFLVVAKVVVEQWWIKSQGDVRYLRQCSEFQMTKGHVQFALNTICTTKSTVGVYILDKYML